VDISDILVHPKTPIFQDSLSCCGTARSHTGRKFPSLNREILKPIPPTATRKPASIQDYRSRFESLWEESVLSSPLQDTLYFARSRTFSIVLNSHSGSTLAQGESGMLSIGCFGGATSELIHAYEQSAGEELHTLELGRHIR